MINTLFQTFQRARPVLLTAAALGLGGVCLASQAAPAKNLAQMLVDHALAMHPETAEIGISLHSSRGCRSIASTDPSDVGERCERGDRSVMRTHHPHAVKERDGYDVSLPLNDSSGKMVGSLAIEFHLRSGQTRASVIAAATRIEREIASHIPSKASLYR